jgi:universal stress protein A
MNRTKNILVPIDFTPGSEKAVDLACLLARPLGAGLVLLHVYEPPDAASAIVPGADADRDEAESRSFSDRGLTRMRDDLALRGFTDVVLRTEPGAAEQVILDLATADEYALIVMGTHARTGLDRLVQGSVAERVVRSAKCPVLTVHLPRDTN